VAQPTDLIVTAAVRTLANEFRDQIDLQEIRDVVTDCYDRLVAHVPRTVQSYLLPWAHNRLVRRLADRPEPTLNEILLAPVHRL